MVLGQTEYEGMYEANSEVAAIVFVVFVFFFCFFCMFMYTAIITRTYNKIRETKLFISEAMARIIIRESKEKFWQWFNLITFRMEIPESQKSAPSSEGAS